MFKKYKITGFLAIAVLSVLVWPGLSYADWGRHHDGHRGGGHSYRYHDHPHVGLRISFLPDNHFSIGVGRSRYYYYDGLYYSNRGRDYVLVAPPVGAVVRTIPSDYRPIIINGQTYYMDNGIYYVYTPYGYQVVPQPITYVQSAPVVVTQTVPAPTVTPAAPASIEVTANDENTFTINISNNQGGYTPVVLKRSGKGFVGPQGEFYSDFPQVSQLKAMYVK